MDSKPDPLNQTTFTSLQDLLTPPLQSAGASLGEMHMFTSVIAVMSKALGVSPQDLGIVVDDQGTPAVVARTAGEFVPFDHAYETALASNRSARPRLGTLREDPRGGHTSSEFPAEFRTEARPK